MASEIEATALVAEDVTPTTGARGLPLGIAAERHLPRAGNGDDAGHAGRGAREGNETVVRDEGELAGHQFLQESLFVRWTPAEARAQSRETSFGQCDTSFSAGQSDTTENGTSELLAAIARFDVIAGTTAAMADDAAGGIADDGGGGGLAAIDAEEEVH